MHARWSSTSCTHRAGTCADAREADFPANMEAIWWRHWGRLPAGTGQAVVVGQWGGGGWNLSTAESGQVPHGGAVDGSRWQRTLASFMRTHSIGHFYWTVRPCAQSNGHMRTRAHVRHTSIGMQAPSHASTSLGHMAHYLHA